MLRHGLLVLAFASAAARAQVSEPWSLTVDQSAYLDTVTESLVDPATGSSTWVGSVQTSSGEFGAYPRASGVVARVDAQGALVWHATHTVPFDQRTSFVDLCAAPSGGVDAVGTSSTTSSPSVSDLVLARYAADGTQTWAIRYDAGQTEIGRSVAADPGGDVWVTGHSIGAQNATDLLLLRVSPAGSVVFARTWNGTAGGSDSGAAIVADGQGGAYVTGVTNSTGSSSAILLLRVDSAGNEIWSRTLVTGSGSEVYGSDLALDASGNVYVAGAWAPVNFIARAVLLKYDPSGNLLWQRTVNDAAHGAGFAHRVAIDPRGDAVLAGSWDQGSAISQDVFVRKYSPSGSVVWTRSFGEAGRQDFARSLALDAAGEIAVAGGSSPAAEPQLSDALALRLDRDGRVLWARTYGELGLPESGFGLGFGPLGTLVLVATTFAGDQDIRITRLDESSVPFCFGDGTGAACPCGNVTPGSERAGCGNSLGVGARLTADGAAALAGDTLTLRGSGLPNSSALYYQGTTQTGAGAGSVFGDGLRCAGGTIVRLKTVTNSAGALQFPAAGDPSVSVRGQIASPGTRTYQVWYRNAASFCTSDTFNLTNGVQVSWSL